MYAHTSLSFTIVCTFNRGLIVVGGYKNEILASPTCLPRITRPRYDIGVLRTRIPVSLFYSWQHGFRQSGTAFPQYLTDIEGGKKKEKLAAAPCCGEVHRSTQSGP